MGAKGGSFVRGAIWVGGGGWRQETPMERITRFIVRWLITAAAVWAAANLVGGIHLKGAGTTLIVALVLGFLNAYVRPLLRFTTLPIIIVTAGLFLIVINTALLALTAWIVGNFTTNFRITSFGAAFWGAVIITVVSFLISIVFNPRRIARTVAGH